MKNEAITILDWGKLKFFLGEVLRNFTRNAGMQATAIGTVAMTIVLLGAFLFIRAALTDLGHEVLNQIEISAYLTSGVTTARVQVIGHTLAHDPRIKSAVYISKKQGLAQLRKQTRGIINTTLLTENPLPDKFRIQVRDPGDVPATAAAIRKLPGVQNVVYPQTIVRRLLQLGTVLRRVGLGVIGLFLIVAGIIISNTIRLTVFARRREISIMQLVGATNMYIRLPFICEGFLDGAFGALIAFIALAVMRYALWPKLLLALPWLNLNTAHINTPVFILQLFLVGGAIGVLASWISVGRHLRT